MNWNVESFCEENIIGNVKSIKKMGGVAFVGSLGAQKYAGISVRKYQYKEVVTKLKLTKSKGNH